MVAVVKLFRYLRDRLNGDLRVLRSYSSVALLARATHLCERDGYSVNKPISLGFSSFYIVLQKRKQQ